MSTENEVKKTEKTPEELLAHITNFCTDKLVEYQSASNWKNQDDSIRWYVPGEEYIAELAIKPSLNDPSEYRVTVGVCRKGSDREAFNYLNRGNRADMIDYLKLPDTRREIIDSVNALRKEL